MKTAAAAALLLAGITQVFSLTIRQANGGATIDIAKSSGPAAFQASGWIYGFPDNGIEADTSIPEEFVRDVKFVASRAGGAQTPTRGWVDGYASYLPRLQSTVSNYRSTRKYGGTFILLVHDLWGADSSKIPLFPGDNGNWTETDAFLQQLVKDIRDYNMVDGLVIDLWNEPDLSVFWDRSWEQFLEYYVHAHKLLRREMPNAIFSGPSTALPPSLGDGKWKTWLSTIAGNDTIPDIYSWHQIGSWSRQPDATIPDFHTLKDVHSLPDRPIDVNEYASKEEQNPGTSVYYIAQLERHNLRGLRANWGSTTALHDSLANLVAKDANGKYYPNGEWQLYKYYAGMEGERLVTTASSDSLFDVFATKSGNTVKIIAGTRNRQAPYEIKISGLTSIGAPEAGNIKIRSLRFDWAGESGEVGPPEDLGIQELSYDSGVATLLVNPATSATAYAYEIVDTI